MAGWLAGDCPSGPLCGGGAAQALQGQLALVLLHGRGALILISKTRLHTTTHSLGTLGSIPARKGWIQTLDPNFPCLHVWGKRHCTHILPQLHLLCCACPALLLPPHAFHPTHLALSTRPTLHPTFPPQVELKGMADRIKTMRTTLHTALREAGAPGSWEHILQQIGVCGVCVVVFGRGGHTLQRIGGCKGSHQTLQSAAAAAAPPAGMFSYTGLTQAQVQNMVQKWSVWMTSDGRIRWDPCLCRLGCCLCY